MNKWVNITILVLFFSGFLVWLFKESIKSLPGEMFSYNCDNFIDFSKFDTSNISDKCRLHVPEGTKVNYISNPPTFGPHYPSWITKGFYTEPRPDGNLVHSQEHGYVIIWYDCEQKLQSSSILVPTVLAQTLNMTSGSPGSPSAVLKDLPKQFSDGSCSNLTNQLQDVYRKFGPHKLIIMPRVGMNNPIILTAWNRMEKLTTVDQGTIKEFIDSFRDNGPEQTVEP